MHTSSSPSAAPKPGSQRKLWIGIALGVLASLMIVCGFGVLSFNLFRGPMSKAARAIEASARCESLYQQGNLDSAVESCSEAIRLDPENSSPYVTRGYILMSRGDNTEALADFDMALRYDPDNGQAYINRGIVYERMGKYDKAIANYDEMLAHNITNSTHRYYGYNNRGVAYQHKEEPDLAIQDYKHAIAEQPDLPEAYENLEGIFAYNNNLDDLIVIYSDLIQQVPDSPDLRYQRGLLYRNTGKPELALEDFRYCLTQKPSDVLKKRLHSQIRELEPLVK